MRVNTLQTVTEAQANPLTREIYNDIKSTMGVALVNLIWRHLAVSPAVLQWSWHVLKPHYASGAIPAAAWMLREKVETTALAAFSATEWSQLRGEVADLSELDAVLRTYERGNAQNLVAMCYLRLCIDLVSNNRSPDQDTNQGTSQDTRQGTPAPPSLNAAQRQAERRDRLDTAIPPLPGWDDLNADIQNQIIDMSAVWVPAKYKGPTPSVFRHIAHWPNTLKLYRERLCSLQNMPVDPLTVFSAQAIKHANEQATQLEFKELEFRALEFRESGEESVRAIGVETTSTEERNVEARNLSALTTAELQWLHQALDLFINGMIGRGVAIVPAMRALLAATDNQ